MPGLLLLSRSSAKLTDSDCLPEWALELPRHFAFLFPFETRYSFLESTSYGYSRLITRSQASLQSSRGNRRDDLSHLARMVRQKVRIARDQAFESAAKVLELYGASNGILEIEYFNEIGTGLGPTLEFYTIVSEAFARRSLNIWRDEDETQSGEHVVHPRGLFPAPLPRSESRTVTSGSKLGWFKALGTFVARALIDSRIINLNFNRIFLKMVLSKNVPRSITTLKVSNRHPHGIADGIAN